MAYMADISEFQSNIEAPSYLKNHKSIICRVHNGYRRDNMMPSRLNYLRSYPFTAIGWYQYLPAEIDAAKAAHDFISVVKDLKVNEFPILDVEEGSGSQVTRAKAWFSVVDDWANFTATLYSGLYFFNNNLGGSSQWKNPNRPIWIAAYGQAEPTTPHLLWQYTDHAKYTAITPPYCDGNLYHGYDKDFIHQARHAKSA